MFIDSHTLRRPSALLSFEFRRGGRARRTHRTDRAGHHAGVRLPRPSRRVHRPLLGHGGSGTIFFLTSSRSRQTRAHSVNNVSNAFEYDEDARIFETDENSENKAKRQRNQDEDIKPEKTV